MTSIGHATLDVIPSVKGLRSELEKQTGSDLDRAGVDGGARFGSAAGKSAGSRFGSLFKSAAKGALVGAAALAAGSVKLAFDSISAASDLEESTNKVTQVFGKGADSILKFTETTADALGQTNNEARSAAATFGIFGNAAGLADKKNARFAKRMTTLASDLASFNNTDPSQAVEALGAALRGESEPIRAYGVMLDEATLKAEALSLGILKPVKDQSKIFAYQTRITDLQQSYNEAVKEHGKSSLEALKAEASLGTARTALQKATEGTIPPLTQQQKLLAAQSQIFKQTNVAQGDFARTSDGLANQQRRLSARFEDAKAKLGAGLLPIMTDAADFLLDKGIPAFEDFADWFNKKGIPAIKDFAEQTKPALRVVRNLVDAFGNMPTGDKLATFGGALAGGVTIKHQFAKIFERGGIANPMFVTVTNGGFGTGTPGTAVGAAGLGGAAATWGARAAAAMRAAAMKAGWLTIGITISDQLVPDPKTNDILKHFEATDGQKEWVQKNLLGNDSKNPMASLLDPTDAQGTAERIGTYLDHARAKAAGFGRELDLVGARKVNPTVKSDQIDRANEAWSRFADYQRDAGRPVTPYINTTSIERAIEVARTLNSVLASQAQVDRGADGGVNYMHGGGAGTNGRMSAGILVDQRGSTIVAHDYDDFTGKLLKKAQAAGLGGRPS